MSDCECILFEFWPPAAQESWEWSYAAMLEESGDESLALRYTFMITIDMLRLAYWK